MDNFGFMPEILACDDWLNWYWKRYRNGDDDYSFLYLGGNKTATGLHHDVMCSYSCSYNICGVKRWTLWHPSAQIEPNSQQNSVHCSDDTLKQIILQNELDILFVPSGWHHTVENISEASESNPNALTASINRNWFNAFSIYEVWLFIVRELNAVRNEIGYLRKTNNNAVSPLAVAAGLSNVFCKLF
jgi:hypothetical protein